MHKHAYATRSTPFQMPRTIPYRSCAFMRLEGAAEPLGLKLGPALTSVP